jgi:membrane fusion protein, heavy metal efflux system
VGKTKAEFLQGLALVKSRALTLARLQAIDQHGAIAQRHLQEAETALREARIRLFNEQQALLNLGLHLSIEELENMAEKQLVRHLRLLGLPESIQRGLDTDSLTANLLPLAAPFDGLVVDRSAAVGEVVQMTQPKTLFVVADVRVVHIDLDVNAEDMPGVRVGQAVSFRPDGSAFDSSGAVSHISPEVDEKTRRVRVHAETPNPDGRLRPNTFGTGRIVIGERPGVVVVPGEAVQDDGATNLVFIRVSDTAFEARKVQLGLREGNLVEVKGVQPGEEVVTGGSFVLKSELQKERITGGDE